LHDPLNGFEFNKSDGRDDGDDNDDNKKQSQLAMTWL
jgi:hypothetical protein